MYPGWYPIKLVVAKVQNKEHNATYIVFVGIKCLRYHTHICNFLHLSVDRPVKNYGRLVECCATHPNGGRRRGIGRQGLHCNQNLILAVSPRLVLVDPNKRMGLLLLLWFHNVSKVLPIFTWPSSNVHTSATVETDLVFMWSALDRPLSSKRDDQRHAGGKTACKLLICPAAIYAYAWFPSCLVYGLCQVCCPTVLEDDRFMYTLFSFFSGGICSIIWSGYIVFLFWFVWFFPNS